MSDDPMVAVLREHRQYAYAESGGCECCSGPLVEYDEDCRCGFVATRGQTYAAHLADVLRAAGYIHRDEVLHTHTTRSWDDPLDVAIFDRRPPDETSTPLSTFVTDVLDRLEALEAAQDAHNRPLSAEQAGDDQ